MRSLLFVLMLPMVMAAQQRERTSQPPPPSQAPETKPEDRCVIEGQVFSAATGEPVKKANLILRRADVSPSSGNIPTSYSTVTDAGGSFAMKDVDPGQYRLSVTRTGFVTGEYGARGPQRPGTTLTLAAGQHLQDVNFRLTPHAVIVGRVVDEDGEPVAGAQVQAMRYRYIQGRKQLQPLRLRQQQRFGRIPDV